MAATCGAFLGRHDCDDESIPPPCFMANHGYDGGNFLLNLFRHFQILVASVSTRSYSPSPPNSKLGQDSIWSIGL